MLLYIASVAKTAKGLQEGKIHYQKLSKKHQKIIMMVNAVGLADNFINAGQSVVYANGKQITTLNKNEESILFFDTTSNTFEIIS